MKYEPRLLIIYEKAFSLFKDLMKEAEQDGITGIKTVNL
jgi:hypothetical protein